MTDEDLRTLYLILSEVRLYELQNIVRDSGLDPMAVRKALDALSATQPNESPLIDPNDLLV